MKNTIASPAGGFCRLFSVFVDSWRGLRPLQGVCYGLLMLMFVLIPFRLTWAAWASILLCLVAVVDAAAQRRVVTNKALIVVAVTMAVYWLWHLVGMMWTGSPEEGWKVIGRKLCFLYVPLTFVITDWKWLNRDRLRILLYVFTAMLVVLFLGRLGMAVYRHIGTEGKWITSLFLKLDPVHHNYMSLYLLVAMAFGYSELSSGCFGWKKGVVWGLVFLLLLVFLVLKNSRGGLLCFGVMAVFCWLHQLIFYRRVKLSVILVVMGLLMLGGARLLIPEGQQRITKTVSTLKEGKGDIRLEIYGASWRAICQHPLLGVGTGHVCQAVYEQFEAVGTAKRDKDAHLNAHNIYLQSWLAGGVVGFLSLMALLGVPMAIAYRRKDLLLALTMVVFVVSGLVESLFERQMAILFFCEIVFVLVAAHPETEEVSCEE